MKFETVCGLEVHAELSTKSKIFCSCSNEFGAQPNTNTCEFCLGMPGTLPVLNEKVLEYAIKCALALNCEITRFNKFDRKNYFYPDLPKAYQISQLYLPFCRGGYVEINDSVNGGKKRIRIHEIHMEEDAGKLVHSGNKSYINYNRAGVPLLEIVSEPDLANGREAAEYTEKLREILLFCGISDCKMQEGSLRADVNVSVREKGSNTLGIRTEMKNLASFKAIALAVDEEAKRQIIEIESGRKIVQQTRRWDEDKSKSFSMRNKESASDYKYFPEPDIPPLEISEEYIQKIKDALPELPDKKRERYIKEYNLTSYDAEVICASRELVNLFEETVKLTQSPKLTAKKLMGEVMMLRKNKGSLSINAGELARIINLEKSNKISRESARELLFEVFENSVDIDEYIKEHSLEIVNDTSLIESVVIEVISSHEKAVNEFRAGKEKSFNFLLGQAMRMLGGKAAASEVKRIMLEKLYKQ